jgi:phosphoglycerate dehydrogenase-like enzyme
MIVVTTPLVAERYGDRVRAAAPGVELASISAESGPWQEGDVAYFSEDFWTDLANRDHRVRLFTLPKLRWFHSFSAGTDNPAFRALLERGVLVTNSSGASSPAIAQYVLGMMLRVAKRMDQWSNAQAERRWQSIPTRELTDMTVGIVGLGSIGGEVARLTKAFGMHVIGLRRNQRRARYVDTLVPPERLPELLAASDFVVLAVPLTARTELLIGEAELLAMRHDAWLINIARGRVVDEPALVRALRERWIAGAFLDVFWEEPLPPDHELWSLPNAIVTPHNSGWSPLNMERGVEIFLDNLGRYAAKRRLRNLVRLDS